MQQLKWTTQPVRWVDLIPYEQNARKIKAENSRKLEESLTEFDVVEIPICDADMVLIGGHQRRAKMIALGRGEELVDVRMPNRKLTEHEFKKLNLLLNSEKYKGEYDLKMLEEFFSEFEFDDFGIEMPDVKGMVDGLPEEEQEPEYPIVPKYSEKYKAVIIVIENEIDENFVRSVLGIERAKDYKSDCVAPSYILSAKQFTERWNSR